MGRVSTRADAIARGVVVQFIARAVGLVASVATLSLSTRYLGIDQYGLLTTAIVFVGLFEIGTDFGLSTVITMRVSATKGGLAHLVDVSLGLKLVIGAPLVIISAVSGLVIYHGQPQAQGAVAIISIGLIFTAIAESYEPVFMVHMRFSAASAADLTARMLGLVATVAVVRFDLGLMEIAAVQLVTPISKFVFTALGARGLERLRPRFEMATTLSLLREGIPFTVIIVVGVLYWRADGAILSWMSGPDQVGAYGVAYSLAFNLEVISVVFASSTLSTLSALAASDLPRFDQSVRLGYSFLLVCAMPISALGVPLARPLLQVFSGESFVDSATPVLRLFFVGVAIAFLNQHLTNALVSLHKQQFLLRLSLVNLLVNVALNVVLIPHLGALGAGISMVGSQLAGLLAGGALLHRLRPHLFPLDQVLRLLPVCALAVGAVAATAPLGLLAQLPAGGLTVVLGAFVFRAVPTPVIDILMARLGRLRQIDRWATSTSDD